MLMTYTNISTNINVFKIHPTHTIFREISEQKSVPSIRFAMASSGESTLSTAPTWAARTTYSLVWRAYDGVLSSPYIYASAGRIARWLNCQSTQ